MWEELGRLLRGGGSVDAPGMLPFGGNATRAPRNFVGLLSQVLDNPTARAAFLDKAALAADPKVFGLGATPPAQPDYNLMAGRIDSTGRLNPAARLGLKPPDPGFAANQASQAIASGAPVDYSFAAGMPPSVGMQATFPTPQGGRQTVTGEGTYTADVTSGARQPRQAPQLNLGALLNAAGGMSDSKREQPQPLRQPAVSAGGGGHGSVNRVQAPMYLPPTGSDPQAAQRRATLAMLLGGR